MCEDAKNVNTNGAFLNCILFGKKSIKLFYFLNEGQERNKEFDCSPLTFTNAHAKTPRRRDVFLCPATSGVFACAFKKATT